MANPLWVLPTLIAVALVSSGAIFGVLAIGRALDRRRERRAFRSGLERLERRAS